uniref:NADH-ubiquinone oxidoreductase chain 1 n=1 Tax=Romanomermis iyengari TaxID=416168 RepID=A1Z3B5_ROMIY|nr:NADH dehydrogenase subunit 1 [Romanomermis iyengari]ABL73799.1 NADH dehydrogenase subunit 1 [Romanomermis iyengari]
MKIIFLLKLICILLSIAYFTLSERKILSLSQLRLGPNKTSLLGVIQPVLDGLKLLKKVLVTPMNMMYFFLVMNSIMMFSISLLLWFLFPFFSNINKNSFLLWLLLLFGFLSYFILLIGWSSVSKFSYLGGVRGLSQSLSFEVLVLLIVSYPFLLKNTSLLCVNYYSLLNNVYILLFFIISILECQRAPMDLSEGESELVSGYNIEMSSLMFIFIFLSEYNSMIFLMSIMWLIFMKINIFLLLISLMLVLLIRSCFPRLRYDYLMTLFWLKILPLLIISYNILMNLKNFSFMKNTLNNLNLLMK